MGQGEGYTPGILHHAFQDRDFGPDTCFLCGVALEPETHSDEHVIPRWVQRRFDLWNQELTLLNGTHIRYRQLTIPCCRECNNVHLGRIEKEVEAGFTAGVSAVRDLPQDVLFVWLGKIFYGLLYRELLLPLDRRGHSDGTIISQQDLAEYEMHHFFVQSARLPITFQDCFPASIFIFELQEQTDPRLRFDFRDSMPNLAISVQLGGVGVVATLQDGGAQAAFHSTILDKFQRYPLHPLQFAEVTARVFHLAERFDRTPKYMLAEEPGGVRVFQLPLGGLTLKPVFRPWDSERYANLLALFTGYPLERLFIPPDSVMSWLHDTEGNPRQIRLEELKWP